MASNITPKQFNGTATETPAGSQSDVNNATSPKPLYPSFLSIMGTDMVDLYVGPTKAFYRVHKKLLCDKVPYFNKMFNGGFSEATTAEATFPEDTSESFDLLMVWIYNGSLPTLVICEENNNSPTYVWDPVGMYRLADKLCLPKLCDEVMDRMMDLDGKEHALPSLDVMEDCYTGSRKDSPLRQYAARMLFFVIMQGGSGSSTTDWTTTKLVESMVTTRDLTEDILNLIREKGSKVRKVLPPSKLPRCDFHLHGTDEPCYASKKEQK